MAYDDKTGDELRDELRSRGLATSGSKAELVARLEEHDASPSPAPDGDPSGNEPDVDVERARLAPDDGGPESAAEKAELDPDAADPYPAYEAMALDALAALADDRGVAINADVERAEWIGQLRKAAVDRGEAPAANLDLLSLDTLRSMAADLEVTLPDAFVRAHLVTELRAADTGA